MDNFKEKVDHLKIAFIEMKKEGGVCWSAVGFLVLLFCLPLYFGATLIAELYAKNKVSNAKIDYIYQMNNSHVFWYCNFIAPSLGTLGISRSYNDLFTGLIEDCTHSFKYNLVGLTQKEQSDLRKLVSTSVQKYYATSLRDLPFDIRVHDDELVVTRRF